MSSTPASAPAPAALSGVFVNSIAVMNNGEVVNDIDDALREAVRAATVTGKAAKVKIELSIIPAGTGAGDMPLFRVDDDITLKLPKKKRSKAAVFFADDNCNLTRRNPKQDEMRLESIDGGKTALTRTDIIGGGQARAASNS